MKISRLRPGLDRSSIADWLKRPVERFSICRIAPVVSAVRSVLSTNAVA
jgi:hypothetical protein